jgi:hypothetical protein
MPEYITKICQDHAIVSPKRSLSMTDQDCRWPRADICGQKEDATPMSFSPSPPLSRRRPLSAHEIAAIANATVTACPAPNDVPDGNDRLRRVGGTWRRSQVEAVKSDG